MEGKLEVSSSKIMEGNSLTNKFDLQEVYPIFCSLKRMRLFLWLLAM